MIRYTLLAIALLLVSCSPPPPIPPALAQSPQPVALPSTTDQSSGQKQLSLKLTLSSPEDLRVREGDFVMVGQVLSDRVKDRQRLDAQRKQLELQIAKVSQTIPKPLPLRQIPPIAGLPAPSFLENVADIEATKLKIEKANRERENQQRKLDQLMAIPQNDIPQAVIPHEQELLKQREREVSQANAELDISRARLGAAQGERQYREYLASLEHSKREASIQQSQLEHQRQMQEWEKQERDRSFQVAQLQEKLAVVDAQLQQISMVRSPYGGKVRRIKWTGQSNQDLTVELTLAISGRGSSPAVSPSPSPSSSPGAGASPGAKPES
jgi:hypothetical protein